MEASIHSHNGWSIWVDVCHCAFTCYACFHVLFALFPSAPHLNFVYFWVSSRKGAYLGMNFDRYPVTPRKLVTASIYFGGLLSFTALILSGFGFNPAFPPEFVSIDVYHLNSILALVRVECDSRILCSRQDCFQCLFVVLNVSSSQQDVISLIETS